MLSIEITIGVGSVIVTELRDVQLLSSLTVTE